MVLGGLGVFFLRYDKCLQASFSHKSHNLFLFSNLTIRISLPLRRHGGTGACREYRRPCTCWDLLPVAHSADREHICLATSEGALSTRWGSRAGQVHPQLLALFLSKEEWTLISCQEVFLTRKACFPRCSHLLRLSFLLWKRRFCSRGFYLRLWSLAGGMDFSVEESQKRSSGNFRPGGKTAVLVLHTWRVC